MADAKKHRVDIVRDDLEDLDEALQNIATRGGHAQIASVIRQTHLFEARYIIICEMKT